MDCSICGLPIPAVGDWTQGNDAHPVNDGRCCNECDILVVVPARLREMRARKQKKVGVNDGGRDSQSGVSSKPEGLADSGQ